MLHLAASTSPAWASWALAHLDEILLDHAHCEKKAASTAINLIFKYAHHPALMLPLSALAREELEHFEQVVGQVRRRGAEYQRLQPSTYAGKLMTVCRTDEPDRLLDTLLCCAMIEARSCERMQLLHGAMKARDEAGAADADVELTELYRSLLACEARHHATYVDLARAIEVASEAEIRERLAIVAAHEADVVAELPDLARLHNGPAGTVARHTT